ncbi:hypothetical protein TNIN_316771 [Trichonephila inaurata madagascariensis]|uniref:Uncharacterized protein n=1 Tax=Trichonephila inaurata madagascariensis TaxID=2747483 RepID=A0A8X6XK11_9ARAC|nr:hypothetical protein TNIN_316771 [Trichonephila inaurata madagascariensis]
MVSHGSCGSTTGCRVREKPLRFFKIFCSIVEYWCTLSRTSFPIAHSFKRVDVSLLGIALWVFPYSCLGFVYLFAVRNVDGFMVCEKKWIPEKIFLWEYLNLCILRSDS